jgi:hypothetical protein
MEEGLCKLLLKAIEGVFTEKVARLLKEIASLRV